MKLEPLSIKNYRVFQGVRIRNSMDGDYRKADAGVVTEVNFIQQFGPFDED